MSTPSERGPMGPLPDPWCRWPAGDPYEILADAGVGPQSTQAEVDDAFLWLMELGLVDDAARTAHETLRLVGRRLLTDALRYDGAAAAEMFAALREGTADETPVEPLSRRVPFSWDV